MMAKQKKKTERVPNSLIPLVLTARNLISEIRILKVLLLIVLIGNNWV